jgi:uncharacterized protein YndB with AHSA1/START domain
MKVTFTNTITIGRQPAEVFAFLARFENVPRWNHAIAETRRVTGTPVGVGSRYVQTRTVPTRTEETFEVIGFEPDRSLAVRGSFGRFPADIAYVLEPVDAGTRLVNDVELTPGGLLSAVAPLVRSRVKAAVAANLEELKHVLEGT